MIFKNNASHWCIWTVQALFANYLNTFKLQVICTVLSLGLLWYKYIQLAKLSQTNQTLHWYHLVGGTFRFTHALLTYRSETIKSRKVRRKCPFLYRVLTRTSVEWMVQVFWRIHVWMVTFYSFSSVTARNFEK